MKAAFYFFNLNIMFTLQVICIKNRTLLIVGFTGWRLLINWGFYGKSACCHNMVQSGVISPCRAACAVKYSNVFLLFLRLSV